MWYICKKAASLLLCALLFLCLSSPVDVAAADSPAIVGVADKTLEIAEFSSAEGIVVDVEAVVYFPLDSSYFLWEDDVVGTPTASLLKRSGVGAQQRGGKGVKSTSIEDTSYGTAVVVRFGSPARETMFTGEVYLTFNNKKTGATTPLSGVIYGTGESLRQEDYELTDAQREASRKKTLSDGTEPADREFALQLTKSALAKTGANETTYVRMSNITTFNLAILQEMVTLAGNRDLTLRIDSMFDQELDVRLTLNPRHATKTVNLQAHTYSDTADRITWHLDEYYTNRITVVSFSQKGDFGMRVAVTAKLRNGLLDKNLVFYHYDRQTNKYEHLPGMSYWVDKNGYVHFETARGDNILITDRKLTPKD